MASPSPITVRRPPFTFPDGLEPVIIDGRPEESYVMVSLSLLLPYLEPYLIRSMKEARQRLTDPALGADLDAFNAQEGQHYRQHKRFNDAVRLQGGEAIAALSAELDADYRRFTATRSLRWNLAYAEGFEAYTSALASFSFATGQIARVGPPARGLFEWHLLEELEHRTVAFDVYQHVCGGYLYRLVIGLYAQWHLTRFVLRAASAMIRADGEAFRARWGGRREAWARLRPLLGQMARVFVPAVFRTYLPWYTPHRLSLPEGAQAMVDGYGEAAPPG